MYINLVLGRVYLHLGGAEEQAEAIARAEHLPDPRDLPKIITCKGEKGKKRKEKQETKLSLKVSRGPPRREEKERKTERGSESSCYADESLAESLASGALRCGIRCRSRLKLPNASAQGGAEAGRGSLS